MLEVEIETVISSSATTEDVAVNVNPNDVLDYHDNFNFNLSDSDVLPENKKLSRRERRRIRLEAIKNQETNDLEIIQSEK